MSVIEIQSLLVTAAGITLAYFLVPPILIYSIQRVRRDMQLLEFDPASIPNSGVIEQFFDEAIEDMERIGFECLCAPC